MNISRKSILFKWAYLPEVMGVSTEKIPTRTTLARIIGRSFVSVFFLFEFLPIAGTIYIICVAPWKWLADKLNNDVYLVEPESPSAPRATPVEQKP